MSARKPSWCLTPDEFLRGRPTEGEYELARLMVALVVLWLAVGSALALAQVWGWL